MTFLVAQILLCLALAFLLGLFVGWLLWRFGAAPPPVDTDLHAEYEKNLDASRARTAMLERELAALRAETLTLAPVPDAAPETVRPPAVAEPARDDLKRITGIGPVIERQLAQVGITTYRQIARFTDDDIERVGMHIDFFPDRIRREGWVDQAAALHRETHGGPI